MVNHVKLKKKLLNVKNMLILVTIEVIKDDGEPRVRNAVQQP